MMSVKQSEGESDRKSCGRRASQVKNRDSSGSFVLELTGEARAIADLPGR
jgi:hypothetical protein